MKQFIIYSAIALISFSGIAQNLDVNGNIRIIETGIISANRGRLGFSNVWNDWNHTIYNNGSNIDGEGNWDGMKFNIYAGANFRIGQAKTSALFINENGNIGIGTITPSENLEVNGNIKLSSSNIISANRGRVGFSNVTDDWNHTIYNNGSNIDGEGSWDGMKFNIYAGANFRIGQAKTSALFINNNGNIGIGTTTPDATLAVKGHIHTQEVLVDLNGAVVPDFVFEPGYKLRTLAETERYINQHKHLPEIPSATEMEANGMELKAMNLKLLQKIEELTLQLIALDKKVEAIEAGNQIQKSTPNPKK